MYKTRHFPTEKFLLFLERAQRPDFRRYLNEGVARGKILGWFFAAMHTFVFEDSPEGMDYWAEFTKRVIIPLSPHATGDDLLQFFLGDVLGLPRVERDRLTEMMKGSKGDRYMAVQCCRHFLHVQSTKQG